jgi:hypothetical protein
VLIDLDIRAIKIQLGMDVLRCQSPEMVRKEIWTCLRPYNLIRKTILESAKRSNLSPRQIRFTAAMQKVAASWESVLLLSLCRVAATDRSRGFQPTEVNRKNRNKSRSDD